MKDNIVKIFTAISVCLIIGFMSGFATQSSINDWYVSLNKPSFNPPNEIFGPVWVVLYVMMGIAAGLVWQRGFYHKWVKTALYHFGFQLLLNGMWSITFFGLRKPFIGLLVIIALIVMIILTIRWFKVVDKRAAYLMYPYLAWVLFATILNFSIWQLN
ncbi:TspO/MBR family protein [Spongiivirga citrea]|uniref:Tryptophan-rich sensory protein n=1 Tax=Spongiivirga citrea TaxID=1481457 RepID=A0A6M0CJP1_9FLAO|nr:TspO/MBR family protein [Spongiivirga citrea]NER18165.1 tryptophan-rich sensory protein [Spongiivirga citrea]